jgi:hypothetical protein
MISLAPEPEALGGIQVSSGIYVRKAILRSLRDAKYIEALTGHGAVDELIAI